MKIYGILTSILIIKTVDLFNFYCKSQKNLKNDANRALKFPKNDVLRSKKST